MSRNDFLLVVLFGLFSAIFLAFVVHEAGWLSGFMEASFICEDLLHDNFNNCCARFGENSVGCWPDC